MRVVEAQSSEQTDGPTSQDEKDKGREESENDEEELEFDLVMSEDKWGEVHAW